MSDVDAKSFKGPYLLFRRRGEAMQATRPPRCRHQGRDRAIAKAERLLAIYKPMY